MSKENAGMPMTPEIIIAAVAVLTLFITIIAWCFSQSSDIGTNKRELAKLLDDFKDYKSHVEKTILALEARQDTTSSNIYRVMEEISKNLSTVMISVSRIQGYTEGSKKGELG